MTSNQGVDLKGLMLPSPTIATILTRVPTGTVDDVISPPASPPSLLVPALVFSEAHTERRGVSRPWSRRGGKAKRMVCGEWINGSCDSELLNQRFRVKKQGLELRSAIVEAYRDMD